MTAKCLCICDCVQAFYSHPSHLHWITTCTWTMPTAYFSSLWQKKKHEDANQDAILVLFLGRKEVPEVPNVYWKPIYTVCFLMGVKKYLPISRVWKIFMTWNMWHFFTLFGSFWYLAFKVTKKTFSSKLRYVEKFPNFKNKWKYEGNLNNFPDWLHFCSHFYAFYYRVLIFYKMKGNAPKGET